MVVSTSGNLTPPVSIQVGSEVPGTLSEILVDFNDRVTAGQVIARINPDRYESAVSQAQGEMQRTQALLEKAKLAHRQRQVDQPIAEAMAQADLDSADAQLKQAEAEWNRVKQLEAKDVATDIEIVRTESAYLKAKAARDLAAARREQVKASAVEIDILAQEIEQAQHALDQANATLNSARIDLERTTILAPIDGVVIDRTVDVGQTVVATLVTPHLFTIAPDLSNMEVHANVSESEVVQVRRGQRVKFTVTGVPAREFTGRVKLIRDKPTIIQNVVNYVVVIEVDKSEDWLKPDMTVDLEIEVARCQDATLIPNAALRFRPPIGPAEVMRQTQSLTWPELPAAVEVPSAQTVNASANADLEPPIPIRRKEVVWTCDGKRYRPVPIWTGITDHRYTQVLAGDLSAAEQVVTEVQLADTRNILQKMASMAPGGAG
jgi:HlyD family secretion protein